MTDRELLRHSVATLAYRGSKALRDAPESYADLRVGDSTRTPTEILTHIGDLLDWALAHAQGERRWHDTTSGSWADQVERFYAGLAALDERLASDDPVGAPIDRIFQGPIADALQHVGQLTMLRRLGGAPVRGENYFKADITPGRLGPDQAPPAHEFD